MSVPYELALFAERNRNRVYDQVVAAIEEAAAKDGITRSKIAKATGKKLPQISAWLSGPSNWTLDTVSHLLRAIQADMEYSVVFDRDRQLSNLFHPASQQASPQIRAPTTGTTQGALAYALGAENGGGFASTTLASNSTGATATAGLFWQTLAPSQLTLTTVGTGGATASIGDMKWQQILAKQPPLSKSPGGAIPNIEKSTPTRA